MGGTGAERIEPSTGGINLQRRADREALDQAGVFRSGEIIDKLVGQEQLVAEVAREGGCVDFFGTADDGVHLVEVALHDADAAHAGKRHFAQGGLGHIGLAVVFLDDPRFAQELGLEFIEIEHDGKAWTIADEDRDAVPRIDVPARAGHEDAALTLHALALVVGFSFKQLLIGEAAGENQQQDGEGEIEGNHSRVVTLMGLKESARVL